MKQERTSLGQFRKGMRPWNKGLRGAQVSWIKGLTKYTDQRVAKISEALAGVPKLWMKRKRYVGPNKGRRWPDSYRERMSRILRKVRRTSSPIWNKGLTKKTNPSLARMARALSRSIKGVPRPFVSNKQGHRRFWYYGKNKRLKMRSRWEVAYAHWLDSRKVTWLYEAITFVAEEFSYTPDFYIFGTDSFVELKGWVNGLSDEKISALRTRWGVTIDVLHGDDLQKIGLLDEHNRVVAKGRRPV
jgi:hypothetical protein